MRMSLRVGVCLGILGLLWAAGCVRRVPEPAAEPQAAGVSDPNGPVVYVGNFGNTYHRQGCKAMKLGEYPMALKDAQRFYKPCPRCQPPR